MDDADLVREALEAHKRVRDNPDGTFEYETPPSMRPAIAALARLEARIAELETDLTAAFSVRDERFRVSAQAHDAQQERAEAAEAHCERLLQRLREIKQAYPNEEAVANIIARAALDESQQTRSVG